MNRIHTETSGMLCHINITRFYFCLHSRSRAAAHSSGNVLNYHPEGSRCGQETCLLFL